MNETTGSFLFRGWPYLALVLAAAGFVVRLLLTGDRVPALRRAMPRARAVFLGGRPWIAAWLLLAAGHAAGLAVPARRPGLDTDAVARGRAGGGRLRDRRSRRSRPAFRGAWLHMRRPSRGGWSLAADFARFGVHVVPVHRRGVGIAGGGRSPLGIAVGGGHDGAVRGVAAARAARAGVRRAPAVRGPPAPVRVLRRDRGLARHAPGRAAACARAPGARRRRARADGAARPVRAWVQRRPAAWLWPDHEVRWVVAPRADGRPTRRPRQGPRRGGPCSGAVRGAAAKPTRRQGGVMRARWIVFGVVLLGAGGGLIARGATRIGVHQGYAPEQPIAFPHKVHAGDNKIPCLYCHSARAHQPARRHPVGERVHELPLADRETDDRDPAAEGGVPAAAARSSGRRSTTSPTSSTSTTASTSCPASPASAATAPSSRWTASNRRRR